MITGQVYLIHINTSIKYAFYVLYFIAVNKKEAHPQHKETKNYSPVCIKYTVIHRLCSMIQLYCPTEKFNCQSLQNKKEIKDIKF